MYIYLKVELLSLLESILEILSYPKVLKTLWYKIYIIVLLFAFQHSIVLDFIRNILMNNDDKGLLFFKMNNQLP